MGARGGIGNGAIAGGLASVVVVMVGLAYAAVPLYDLFCKATGYGGTPRRAEAAAPSAAERMITVRFDANVRGLPWRFEPKTRDLRVRLGETATLAYVATNLADRATAGTATYNVTPLAAGTFFNKLDCFCFTRQELGPGETAELGIQFFVDPALAEDREGRAIQTITLSYTFHQDREGAQPVARLGEGAGAGKL